MTQDALQNIALGKMREISDGVWQGYGWDDDHDRVYVRRFYAETGLTFDYEPPTEQERVEQRLHALETIDLDDVQLALDVIGVADPTGIADGTNAIISMGRGNWVDAGISAAGIVFVVGDAAKLLKVGKGTAKRIKTSTGLEISGFTGHAVNRAVGDAAGRAGVKPHDILDALNNPLKVGPVKTDQLGRQSQRFVGQRGEVVVNPQTGKIISVNPTSAKKAERLIRLQGQ